MSHSFVYIIKLRHKGSGCYGQTAIKVGDWARADSSRLRCLSAKPESATLFSIEAVINIMGVI